MTQQLFIVLTLSILTALILWSMLKKPATDLSQKISKRIAIRKYKNALKRQRSKLTRRS